MPVIIIAGVGKKSYPECNNWAYRNGLADEIQKVVDGLRNTNVPMGTKADFAPDGDGWTAFYIGAIGNNGKSFDAVFGINIPAKDTGLGASSVKGGGDPPPPDGG